MEVTITNEDLKYIKKLKNKSYRREYNNIFISMLLYIVIATIMLYVVLSVNDIDILNYINDFIFPVIATVLMCILIFLLEKHIKRKLSIYKKYSYLLNTFEIIIDDKGKSILLESFNIKINLLITPENIKISDEIIFLLDENEVIGIIPLLKIKNKDILIKEINKYMGRY
ncbi:MAG: hypothetical protein ACRC41_12955 [Sarcina sp.]